MKVTLENDLAVTVWRQLGWGGVGWGGVRGGGGGCGVEVEFLRSQMCMSSSTYQNSAKTDSINHSKWNFTVECLQVQHQVKHLSKLSQNRFY